MHSSERADGTRAVIEPASFQALSAPEVGSPPARLAPAARWLALLILASLLLAVVFVLPRWVADAPEVAHSPVTPLPVPVAEPPAAVNGESPAADGTRDAEQRRRKDAQHLLGETLTRLASLEAAQAETWAKSALHGIRERIAAGEKAYRERRYLAAEGHYRDASARAERLEAEIPATIAMLLDSGELALANGNSARAAAAFEQVQAIAPDNADASAGRARAGSLDRVLALIGQAESYERMQATDEALAAYREAARIDDKAPGAAAAIARIERGQQGLRFRTAMSAGFAALEKQDYRQAQAAFGRAAAIEPHAPEVAAAQQQTANAAAAQDIQRKLRAAASAVAAERWDDAVGAFDAALAIDGELSAALDGKVAAVQRQRLDRRLGTHLAQRERLIEDAVHEEASRALAEASALGDGGKRLAGQVAALATALRLARTPVSVPLHSDGVTTVSIDSIGALGRFDARRLELLPGHYTALGQRPGYRDVRVEFRVTPGAEAPAITIQCDEKHAFGS